MPGPSRVVTGPGRVGIDPETGMRRRRHGVSSVPTSSILHDDRSTGEDSGTTIEKLLLKFNSAELKIASLEISSLLSN